MTRSTPPTRVLGGRRRGGGGESETEGTAARPTRRLWTQSRCYARCWLLPDDRGFGPLPCWSCGRADAPDLALMTDITWTAIALCADCLTTRTGRPVLLGLRWHPGLEVGR